MRALLLGLALLLRAFAARAVALAERGVGALGFAPGQPVRWVGGPWARTMTGVVYEDPEHDGLRVARAVARCERAWPFVAAVEVEVYASADAPVTRLFLLRDEVTGRARRALLRRAEEQAVRDADARERTTLPVAP